MISKERFIKLLDRSLVNTDTDFIIRWCKGLILCDRASGGGNRGDYLKRLVYLEYILVGEDKCDNQGIICKCQALRVLGCNSDNLYIGECELELIKTLKYITEYTLYDEIAVILNA